MKKILYVLNIFILIILIRNYPFKDGDDELIDGIQTISKTNFEVDNNSIFTFTNDGFKCYLPNEPTIQELNTHEMNGKHYFAIDSINYFVYSINITFNDAGSIADEYGNNETYLTNYFDTYLNNAPLLIDPRIIKLSPIRFKSKYTGIEYQIISNEIKSPSYQYGVIFIKDDNIFKIGINFWSKSKHLAEEKYKQLTATFDFLS